MGHRVLFALLLGPFVAWGSACSFDASGSGGAASGADGTTGPRDDGDDGGTVVEPVPTSDSSAGEASGEGGSDPAADEGSTSSGDAESSTGMGVDGCAIDNGGCDDNADCMDLGGQILCACKPGWMGDGMACDSDASLEPLRFEIPCMGTKFGCDLSTVCATVPSAPTVGAFEGTPGVLYEATLRVRGVLEEKTYSGGTAHGSWYEGGSPNPGLYNSYRLDVGAQPYYLNAGTPFSWCVGLDYEVTIVIEGGTALSLSAQDSDECQIRNRDPIGSPIIIPGIPPAPLPFDGQFVQIDLVSAQPLP